LIILDEALNYYEKNDVEEIRYSELKRLCNNRLTKLTNGRQTDFGRSFDKFIEYLESDEEPSKRFLRRNKVSSKKTFIILDVPKVVNLLRKKGLHGSTDDDDDLIAQSLGPLRMSDFLSTAKIDYINDGYLKNIRLGSVMVLEQSRTNYFTIQWILQKYIKRIQCN
jgi:hypothetical protein